MKKSTIHSSMILIDQLSELAQNLNLSSIEGYYVIGVYGLKNSSFTLTIHSTRGEGEISNAKIYMTLKDGVCFKNNQDKFSISSFTFYNWLNNSDLDFELHVFSGKALM